MMGAVTSETCSDFAVNKCLHTVASGWIFINIDVKNHLYSEIICHLDQIPLP